MAIINLQEKFNEIKLLAEKIKFTDIKLSDDFKNEYEKYILKNSPNGYSKVYWAEFSTKIITASKKEIFITNYWFYIAFLLADYLEGLTEQRNLFKEIFSGEKLNEVAVSLRNEISSEYETEINNYLSLKGYTSKETEFFKKFVSDYESWGGGKSIDRNDYYVSPLLQAGNLLAETQSAIAEIAKQFYEEPLLKKYFSAEFVSIKSNSEAFLNKYDQVVSEKSGNRFVYNLIVYILNKKIQERLFSCLYKNSEGSNNYNIEYESSRLTSFFKISETELSEEEISRGNKLRFFKDKFIFDSKYYYLSNQWTDGTDSRLDIQTLIKIFNKLYDDYEIVKINDCYILQSISKYENQKLSKPFLLLAGISGTGKTRFVREQAKASGQFKETYCLVSVRPDWHEPSDLLGYISRLSNHGQAEYITTDVLQFIAKAWRGIADNGLSIEVQHIDEQGERLVVTGDREVLSEVLPYWLCLDEMNLAPVEQYFADYLSVLETREWCWDGDAFTYSSDALLKPAMINAVADTDKLRKDLGFEAVEYHELWQLICEHGLAIPFNLMVAGTVNMDETTHGFSRKVIDRALSFDFGEFFPNNYDEFFESNSRNKQLSYPIWSQAKQNELANACDADGSQTLAFLSAVNATLKSTPFELAYRALNELLLAVISSQPQDELTLKAVWDDFMMCKVLPRIEGDSDKLTTADGKELLVEIEKVLAVQLAPIWNADDMNAPAYQRPDLYREKVVAEDATEDEKVLRIACRSKGKLAWMKKRLGSSMFTSFWP